nr:phage tail protein [uncultured Roseateles sp.]
MRNNIDAVLSRMDGHKKDVVDKAIPRALNRCGEKAITSGSRELRADGYAFSAGEIKAAMSMLKASQGRLVVKLRVKRRTKSLIEFSPRESKAGVSVKIHGARKMIKGAFIAQRLNGKSGVFIEDKGAGKIIIRRAKQYKRGSKGGWHAYPCRKLYGPSVGGVYANDRIQAAMRLLIGQEFETRLAHEIKFLSR